MTSTPVTTIWGPLLALLAAEAGAIALMLALLWRWSPSAGWRRTFCQAGLIAVLVITVGELSGLARGLAGWMAGAIARPNAQGTIAETQKIHQSEPAVRSRPAEPLPGTSGYTEVFKQKITKETKAVTSPTGVPQAKSKSSSFSLFPSVQRLLFAHLGLIWAVGAVLVAARAILARSLFILFRLRRRPVADPALRQRAGTLAQALRMRSRVRVIESARLTSPIAFGWIQPTVGLPLDFSTRFDAARQETMLAHELAHLAARDPFWCLVADAATALLWWHPAVWWMRRRLHLANELAADEASLLVADGPRVLAECLVELGARLARPLPLGHLPVAGFRSSLGHRVQRLMHLETRAWSPPHRLRAALVKSLGPMAMMAMVIACSAWVAPRALMKGNSMKTIHLNWKQSLAALAALAAFNATDAAPAPGSADKPARPMAARPEISQSTGLPSPADSLARKARIEAKLSSMVLAEVKFEVLPLTEVVTYLSQEARKLDREKEGVNFLINQNFPPGTYGPPAGPATLDPTTGLPVPAAPTEAVNMSDVAIKFNLPLRNVTMKDVLEAIVKVADRPIEYSVEDYAVVFSPKPPMVPANPIPVHQEAGPPQLSVRTFKMDTNTIVAGLESAFGIKVEPSAEGKSQNIRTALMDCLQSRVGVPLSKEQFFYNDLNGVVMVRATPEKLELVRAVMKTLGGTESEGRQ